MKLLTIGRSPSCNIVLNSEKVSSLHAEITVLDNGDIFLEDKNSTNGTFVGNNKINSNAEVPIRRGDYIRFANVELQWALVPAPEDNSRYKAIYNIGSNYRNEIHLEGSTVSRFHGSLKITKDDKAFLIDHSKNGTTVNGVKILSGKEYRVKKGDVVSCGGVSVDISKYIPSSNWIKIVAGVAIAAALAGVVFLAISGMKPPVREYASASTYVYAYYYYQVEFIDDPFQFGPLTVDATYTVSDKYPIPYSGTAFFLDRKGRMGTNRHVAVPWEYIKEKEKEQISQSIATIKEEQIPVNQIKYSEDLDRLGGDPKQELKLGTIVRALIVSELNQGIPTSVVLNKYNGLINRFKTSPIKITGRMAYMAVGYAKRNYSSEAEFDRCTVVAESGDKDIDLAILQLNTKKTPENVELIYDIKKARINSKELNPQEESLYTIGYPAGLLMALTKDHQGIEPEIRELKCSKTPGKYNFEFQGESIGGASGSPIFDKKGKLVGVLWGGWTTGATFGLACHIKYLKEMYNKVASEDE
ncbi:FHA domain-containing protein [uncultured Parabacteroides sp.]|uniref:FHA domain-containing protein n=1 Tax=uncultured Parabacteroides sp. TaxID=512312 RepID=UPI0025ECFA0D|nr:FHA domain-containing protein [uncultured Parabacteroides sp.]